MSGLAPAPGVTIRIADRDRVLRFNYNSFCALEAAVGNEDAVADLAGLHSRLQRPRDLLFAALKHEDPELTLEAAADLVDAWLSGGGTVAQLSKKLTEALMDSPFLRSLKGQPEVQAAAASTVSASPSSTSGPTSPSASEPPSGGSA